MNQNHIENRGVHSKSFIYCTGQVTALVLAIHTYRQHTVNGTIQEKKDSLSDFQGLLFVFECIVVIISIKSCTQKEIHTTRTDLHC